VEPFTVVGIAHSYRHLTHLIKAILKGDGNHTLPAGHILYDQGDITADTYIVTVITGSTGVRGLSVAGLYTVTVTAVIRITVNPHTHVLGPEVRWLTLITDGTGVPVITQINIIGVLTATTHTAFVCTIVAVRALRTRVTENTKFSVHRHGDQRLIIIIFHLNGKEFFSEEKMIYAHTSPGRDIKLKGKQRS
jgi:hypothetical protein